MRIEGEGMKINGKDKKPRSDKKVRVQTFIDQDLHKKLSRLSRSCNISESKMVYETLTHMLNNVAFVNWVQDKYKVTTDDPFRIIPQTDEKGKINY
jgi:hypothetical protein